jgi:hypothetical protein
MIININLPLNQLQRAVNFQAIHSLALEFSFVLYCILFTISLLLWSEDVF